MTDKEAGKVKTVVEMAKPAAQQKIDTSSPSHIFNEMRHSPEQIKDLFRNGKYPYKTKIRRASYEKHKEELQVELLKVQSWVKETGQRMVILFEGRDAAGKGGTIKRFMEHLNPRASRVVALEKPTEHEMGEWYFQRYIKHLPTAGEMVFFDRSWYNRAGVERVMGFCDSLEYLEFMRQVPDLERCWCARESALFKYWFSVTHVEQERRFNSRLGDPLKAVEAEPHRSGSRRTSGTNTPRPRKPCSSTRIRPTRPGRS